MIPIVPVDIMDQEIIMALKLVIVHFMEQTRPKPEKQNRTFLKEGLLKQGGLLREVDQEVDPEVPGLVNNLFLIIRY